MRARQAAIHSRQDLAAVLSHLSSLEAPGFHPHSWLELGLDQEPPQGVQLSSFDLQYIVGEEIESRTVNILFSPEEVDEAARRFPGYSGGRHLFPGSSQPPDQLGRNRRAEPRCQGRRLRGVPRRRR